MAEQIERVAASFRDPSGYVFQQNGQIFRRILPYGMNDFEHFILSGLAKKLLDSEKIVPFRKMETSILQLKKLDFISYPYEWSFSQLQDAAMLTLEIMREALKHEIVLKDASAFNIAFQNGRPIFLDHTSFTRYRENEPWCAYRQFVGHFLAPLLLMKYTDLRCLNFFRTDIGGIPLDFASRLLPWHTRFRLNPLIHVHLHAAFERKYSSGKQVQHTVKMPLVKLMNFIAELVDYIGSLKIPHQQTDWADYYSNNSYSEPSFLFKKEVVEDCSRRFSPEVTLDLGANSGVFSEIAARHSRMAIAADFDPRTVEDLYLLGKKCCPNLHPILLDLNNPTPNVGVFNSERSSFFSRCHADFVLGLALIHHLRITGNWSLEQITHLFAELAPKALVEFVPADDVQACKLMRGRETIYPDWNLDSVVHAFQKDFSCCRTIPIPNSGRVLLELVKDGAKYGTK